ncbi:MAG TPA: hypothetical protein PKJ78_07780 [Candidatus Hydrogenedentes bacterium]|nr:hypothetical protein [Candidatus Hydrogenedentota bacterium]
MLGIMSLYTLALILMMAPLAADEPAPLRLGQDAQGPWWMQQTALTPTGGLRLDGKPWWEKAAALEPGNSFLIDDGRGLVRRETFKDRGGRTQDAIVWVIDDDEDQSLAAGGDRDSDCYVADYNRDGTVDRIVDYIDNDGDNDPDEMDIRYFVGGELRYCWFGMDLDDDDLMWSLRGYEYGGESFFESDPHGDNMIFMNKLNTVSGGWSAISECPFAFYDTDADGYSEIAVRCSAVPLDYDPNVDPDYANDYGHFGAPWDASLARIGIVNIRYSFDVDGGSSAATPLHYDVGFNLVGAAPYEYPGMEHFNPKRRPPQVAIVTPWEGLRAICDAYAARETGLSWHEHSDDTIAIGHGENRDADFRWEGVFWTWERRFMENTGGPNQKWNVRREFSATPAVERALYYSGIDRRIHLKHAREGWLQVGHFAGLGAIGEIRMFDTDGNGYFDRWEYDFGDWRRVASVSDERAENLTWNFQDLSKRYMETVLPAATAANRLLMDAMSAVRPFGPEPRLAEAASGNPGNFQRYSQDVLRELQYADFYTYWSGIAAHVLTNQPVDDLRQLDAQTRASQRTSQTAWELRCLLSRIDALYYQGELEEAAKLIQSSEASFSIFAEERGQEQQSKASD